MTSAERREAGASAGEGLTHLRELRARVDGHAAPGDPFAPEIKAVAAVDEIDGKLT